MTVFIVYSSDGDSCGPPEAVFRTERAAEDYKRRQREPERSYLHIRELKVER